jgi:hypothetical protein
MKNSGLQCSIWLGLLAVFGLGTGFPLNVQAGTLGDFQINGYVRQYLSFNLKDVPETESDDKYKMSMNRLSLLLQARGKLGTASVTAIGRVSREQITDYLDDLQTLARATGGEGDFKKHYNENELREFYFDIPIADRFKLRLGRQQVVWGETDFFQALDVVHGYDQSWRLFLEPENEEWRKPLILANLTIDVPELDGNLQLLVRPGFDRNRDIGNTFDMFGGRWSQNGTRGFDLTAVRPPELVALGIPSLPFDHHHSKGDSNKAHYGGRWSGTLGPYGGLAYSLNYYHTQAQNPVLFPSERTAAEDPMGLAFIYPEIDIYGGSVSGYIPFIDSVYRIEAAYIPNQPFNNAFFQVEKKNIVRSMFGLDTNLRLQNLLGTSNASMLSLQVFDTYILSYDAADLIVNPFGTTEDEHTTWLTGIFTLPYKMDTITGQLVVVHDASNGGGVVVPSVEFQFGPSWRLKFEADLFYGGTRSDAPGGATLFGAFKNSDQFLTRITYQF